MKLYIQTIKYIQNTILVGSVVTFLVTLPVLVAFEVIYLSVEVTTLVYTVSLLSVAAVMAIRPIRDLFPSAGWLRPLVILRQSFGVLSASIIVSFLLTKTITTGGTYWHSVLTPEYWSMGNFALLAHLGDITAIVLLVTSNLWSKKVLGPWWKRVQKLAYVYFYAGAGYEYLVFDHTIALWAMVIVTVLVISAFIKNRCRTDPANSALNTTS